MSRTARVQSIEALEQFRAALSIFTDQASQGLATVRSDAERFLNWLGHDQFKYWQHQIRVRDERLAEAKSDLHRCLAATIDPHRTPSCHQEKKLVEQAKRRLEEAEEKLAAVRRWAAIVEEAILDFQAHAEPLAGALATDLPKAVTRLDRIVALLIEYTQLAPPELKTAAAPREGSARESTGVSAGHSGEVSAAIPAEPHKEETADDATHEGENPRR
ncbi:MAG: hypothetical protein K2Y37_13120 [Pirellulales bacterium]|nr:hypothetical protein [Pirellulales bacterium]